MADEPDKWALARFLTLIFGRWTRSAGRSYGSRRGRHHGAFHNPDDFMDALSPDIVDSILARGDARPRRSADGRVFTFNVTIASAIIHIGEPETVPLRSEPAPAQHASL